MMTSDELTRSYSQHFDGNDDLVSNVPMNEVVIDYRLNRSN